ncbi:hypothetical protein D3C81_2122530 [compost metagenome]
MLAMNAWIFSWIGTNNHIWSAAQRTDNGESLRAVSKGSAFKLVTVGVLVTVRLAEPKEPVMLAKVTFQSRQRTAFNSPPMPK